jgi:mutator protein MutT
MPEKLSPLPHKRIGVAIIRNKQGQILIDRRLAKGEMAGLWEFPGGKIELNETVEECIKREISEELAIEVEVGDRLVTIDRTYSNFEVTLFVHHCQYLSGEPQPIECEEIRWVTLAEISNYTFPEANTQIITILQNIEP